MKHIIGKILITALAAIIVAAILPGVSLSDGWAPVKLSIVLGLLNAFIKPILTILTIPITVLTLGVFLFVIDIIIIYFAENLVDGFHVTNILSALFFSIFLSITSSIMEKWIQKTQNK